MTVRPTKRKASGGATRRPVRPCTAEFITYRIGLLAKLFDRRLMPWLARRHGLTLAEWRLLTHLYDAEPSTMGLLASRLRVDKAEISRASAELVRRGYVVRRGDPQDARSALLEITRNGRALHNAILPSRKKLQDDLEACLTRQERACLYRSLDKLTEFLETGNARGQAVGTRKKRRRAS